MDGRKQKPTKDLIMMRPGLRAQVPDSPSLSMASSSSRRPLHYTNAGYENADTLSTGPDYEDLDLYRTAGPRKQPNVIYESSTPIPPSPMPQRMEMHRKRQMTECSDDSTSTGSFEHHYHRSKRTRGKDLLLVFILLISLASLTLVVLMVFGFLGPKCSSCDSKQAPVNQKYLTKIHKPVISSENYHEEIEMLKKNISKLFMRDTFLMGLLTKQDKMIKELKEKLNNLNNNDKESQLTKLQNITKEVLALRNKQNDFTTTLDDLKSKDKSTGTQIKALDHKVNGLSVNVTFLSLNDSLYKSEVSNLIQSDFLTKKELAALKKKDADLDLTVKGLETTDDGFVASFSGLKKFDEDVKTNLSIMSSNVASKIQEITEMVNKINQTGGKSGPPGPPGQVGPAGPKGDSGSGANFSSCVHKHDEKLGAKGSNSLVYVTVTIDKAEVVTGVTCSTEGGDETNLEVVRNSTVYVCNCSGKSSSSAGKSGGSIKCRIDYWVCPRT